MLNKEGKKKRPAHASPIQPAANGNMIAFCLFSPHEGSLSNSINTSGHSMHPEWML